jgi:two-component system response regulator CpxR
MDPQISLLLIDDDRELCELMKAFFAQNGIRAEAASSGAAGLEAALKGKFDLIVLDIMMPDLDGFEVLRRLRSQSDVPVVMLTARTAEQDRIAGLDGGADDYLPKPFGPQELLARIRAVLRRARPEQGQRDALQISGIRLDPNSRTVWQDGKEIPLTAIEFAILEILMRRAGSVVSRDDLANALYRREATPFERTIDVHVSHLRKKLEARGHSYFVTVRGTGYLFRSKKTP